MTLKNIDFETEALAYHERAPRGKIATQLKKPLDSQLDLSVAYSPGVAGPCRAIHKDEEASFRYTGRANLVGVISNGSAVLGLGKIGPYAAKPVMEGKAMLFKKFANIDVFDIEVNADDPDLFIAAVKALEPTFGGINLEDIKAPECFYIEERLRREMRIPVFHDDQHGTAIIAGAAFLNALEITGRNIADVKVVFSGAGAAAIACANLFLNLGVRNENLILCDSTGVIYKGRKEGMNAYKEKFARETKVRTLAEALHAADAFVGVSGANVLKPDMIMPMNKNPIIFALANPDPEILPDVARKHRPDAILATGRSDFPNQVNNVLGFPFIFRGALDVQATTVNEEMKMAAVRAIAGLAKEAVPEEVSQVYSEVHGLAFGKDYLIPKPVDTRVLMRVAPAVAQAAMDSGVARKKVDIEAYKEEIEKILGPTKQIFRQVRKRVHDAVIKFKRKPLVVMTKADDSRTLRAAVQVFDEGEIDICLIGDEKKIVARAREIGIDGLERMVRFVDPDDSAANQQFDKYAKGLYALRQAKGLSEKAARDMIRNHNYFASMMVQTGDADGMLTGLLEPYATAVKPILEVIGVNPGQALAGIYMIVAEQKLYFFADCTINIDPSAEVLADIVIATSDLARQYLNDEPIRVAMLSYASFGSGKSPTGKKINRALEILRDKCPDLIVDGEMQADVALDVSLQEREFPLCKLKGPANVFVFPNLESANISYKLICNISSEAAPTGPILVGVNRAANVLQRSARVDEIVHMIYITAEQAMLAKR